MAREVAKQTATAVHYMHCAGVVHEGETQASSLGLSAALNDGE